MTIEDVVFANLFIRIRQQYFDDMSVSPEQLSLFKQRKVESLMGIIDSCEDYDQSQTYSLASALQEKKRAKIFENERHSIDTSVESLRLLNIIVFNISCIEQRGLSVKGLIVLGEYLRTQGHRVDYVKLDLWISRLYIRRSVSILASLLISVLGFEADEIPFKFRYDKKANQYLCAQMNLELSPTKQRDGRMFVNYSVFSTLAMWKRKMSKMLESIEE